MATGHQQASPMDQAHPYGQPPAPYGAPSPNPDPYHSPAHSPPAQQPYGNPIDQHQAQQQPIQPAPTGQYPGQQQAGVTSPMNEKHEYYTQGQQPPQGVAPAYTQQPGVVSPGRWRP
ncbi:uncharacterized protein KY384_007561 [Bacidia gigantensis]|uniref:uncharacterized protein n=1 Tax=Bacidia gigantensis TaxID=2732470 RepID=UPI001D047A1C|nr:uncharacterized protein KY384_007561 [Bacidia gigantensis]KAG8527409.1 hypothetical protein KY384_007561 [Bacidia gigantensis]